ncbi:tetratricopeptide repeat protein, partial [Methanocalculus sp.]|uniref:tetratricopeptide repeat protein n=1 Tax=Methanocalculus sp. TaxID=2004547 RepID=UPI002725CC84
RMQHPDGSKKVAWVTSDGEMSLFGRTYDQSSPREPIEIDSKNIVLITLQVRALAAIGRFEDVLRMIARLPPEEAKTPSMQLISAEAEAALGNYSGALTHLQAFRRADQVAPEARRLIADILMKSGKYRDALEIYGEILSEEPEDIKALRGRIEAYMRLGSYSSCTEDLKTLIALAPSDWHAIVLYMELQYLTGDPERALALFDTLPEKQQKIPSHRMIRARALDACGRMEEALTEEKAVLADDPDNTSALLHSATLSHRMGDLTLAEEILSHLSERSGNADGISLWHAELLSALGSDQEALSAFNKAVSLNPKNPSALIGRADVYRKLGQYDSSLTDITTVLSIDPKQLHLHTLAGTLLMQRSHYREAAEAFIRSDGPLSISLAGEAFLRCSRFEDGLSNLERFIRSNPDDSISLYFAGIAAEHLGRYPDAIAYYQQVSDTIPDALFRLGSLQNATGAYGEAEEVLGRFCDNHPTDIGGWYTRASAFEHLGQDQSAGDALQEAMNQGAGSAGLLVAMEGVLQRMGRFDDAADVCQTIIDQHPSITMIYRKLGELSTLLGRSDEAADSYRKALREDPDDPILILAAAEAFLKIDAPEEALVHLKHAGEQHPDDQRIWSAMGDALTADGEYLQAVKSYDRAISTGDVPADVHRGRSRALALAGKWKESCSALTDYLHMEESDLSTWFELGRMAETIGDTKTAEKAYRKASGLPGADFAHARTLALLGDDERALEQIEELLGENPDDIDYLRLSSSLLLRMGRYEEAVNAYSRAVQFRKDDHILIRGYASALESAGRYTEAVEVWTKLQKEESDVSSTTYSIARLLAHLGKYRDAARQYDLILADHPDDLAAIIYRGSMAERLGKFGEALNWYEKALSVDSKNGPLWSARGSIMVALGRYNDALKSFDRAIDLSQNEINAWYCKGFVLDYVGKKEQAMACFDHITDEAPDHALAWYQKSRIYDSIGERQEALRSLSQALELDPDL